MSWVAGVDGCHGGWIVVLVEKHNNPTTQLQVRLCRRFQDILNLAERPSVIAIDIPIGLLEHRQAGGRPCDRYARQLLGRRASCVFNPPPRNLLSATRYEEVRPHGISRQTFGILPKISEVDTIIIPSLQQVVHECHPELAFMSLAGRSMTLNKKSLEGREARIKVLEERAVSLFPGVRENLDRQISIFRRCDAGRDDLLDAYVLAETAVRIAKGTAQRVPHKPTVDARGLRMEIWY